MSNYEAKVWGPGGFGTELVPVISWEIGMLMTRHQDECRVREELRRSFRTGERDQGRRLYLAQETACTCGARKQDTSPIKATIIDQRDNRDPAQVGLEYLNRSK